MYVTILPFLRALPAIFLLLVALSVLGAEPADEAPDPEALGLNVVASDAAEERAVLRHEDELVLIRPGDPLPGLDGSEVESIGPRWIAVRLDATRRAWISTAGDGENRLFDLRPPERPPISEPLWIVPASAPSEEPASETAENETTESSRGEGSR